MFSFEELSSVSKAPPSFRIFKPWWDTFMDYLAVIMLMIAVFGGTTQIYKDKTVCLPIQDNSSDNSSRSYPGGNATVEEQAFAAYNVTNIRDFARLSHIDAVYAVTEGKTNLDIQQYRYVNRVCYFYAVPWFPKYFSYFILVHTVALMICSNFWFRFPKTSSKMEHLIFILEKCFESPWTSDVLSLAVTEHSSNVNVKTQEKRKSMTANFKPVSPGIRDSSRGATRDIPVIQRQNELLDKKDWERAKALFEKVKKFRLHVEQEDTIYKLYMGQLLLKTLQCVIILCYFAIFVEAVSFDIICRPGTEKVTGYGVFICTFSIAFLLRRLLLLYLCLVAIYVLLCIRTLFWIIRTPLKQYSFEKRESQFSDIPNVKNDFAFLLHLIDQYDPLYCKHFSTFLSEASEKKLKLLSLNSDWTADKVRQQLIRGSKEQLELHLFMLTGIPEAVYDVTEIQAIKMELCTDINISTKVTQLVHLEELRIVNCIVTIKPAALFFLGNQLHLLSVTFSDHEEVPEWIGKLTRLRALYLIGNVNDGDKRLELEFLKELRYLKILQINSNLVKVPFNVLYVAPHLIELCILNNKNKLEMLHNLGSMFNLARLDLQNCDLEIIPHGIFGLSNLQELNLQGNELSGVEEIESLQRLRKLSSFNLSFNKIKAIPDSISFISSLERFNASNNLIDTLPNSMFTIQKLQHLDMSNNRLVAIAPSIKYLKNLKYLDLSFNRLETLPDELFQCKKLKTLKLNNNLLSSLSGKIQQCSQLIRLELKENSLDELPVEITQCSKLKQSGLILDEYLFEALPMQIKISISANPEPVNEVRLLIPKKMSHPELEHVV
ncbi:volume-regulated anion channel subunit LRRC8D-like [Chiloscyllium plagiosum]|uniref:volume-regulated anion channel subunit LRRC8D-like n=1 Tax=Chiloscyllium plagiosum TaxID=36176 RepID=UPI001CB814FE|nr:volume-regulated anion channel subunit LRRC8D-like [Chiloscyllium plagiosum]